MKACLHGRDQSIYVRERDAKSRQRKLHPQGASVSWYHSQTKQRRTGGRLSSFHAAGGGTGTLQLVQTVPADLASEVSTGQTASYTPARARAPERLHRDAHDCD